MSSQSGILTRFISAMQQVYAFPTEAAADSWTVPPAAAGHRGRYLWTDAFGVVNFLTIYRQTSNPLYLSHAKSLVTAVHSTLGRTRDLSSYLPGASAKDPLGGGLRIGKDDATGPDGDGQYHHYLTLWMFALNRLAAVSGEIEYNQQAICLARAIHPHFVYNRESSRPRMYWKVSTDLKEPLIHHEGNLDPVDGLVVFSLLQKSDGDQSTVLVREIDEYRRIVNTKYKGYSSSDALDLGMTLWTAHWFGHVDEWARVLLERAEHDAGELWTSKYFDQRTNQRLAFRDFGLALGLKCALAGTWSWTDRADSILSSWEEAGLVPKAQDTNSAGMNAEEDLLPITQVMYAAALLPGVFQSTDAA